MFTHTGAGSEQAGGVLTLLAGVTADYRHLHPHPHWLICRLEVRQYTVYVRKRQCRREGVKIVHHFFYRYICNYVSVSISL